MAKLYPRPGSWWVAVAAGLIVVATASMARGDQAAVLAEIGANSSAVPRLQHVFGGRPVSVPVTLYGATGVRADFKARLFQLAKGTAAPLGEYVTVATDVDFGSGPRRDLAFSVSIPAVEREARFEVVVLMRVHPSGDWRRIGSLPLRAYPNDLLKTLKRSADQRPLRLQDPSGKLEHFLTEQGISFVDPSARSLEKSESPAITLVVDGSDDLASAKTRARRGEAVVVFRERVGAFPRIERVRWPGGALLIVELELLDRLASDPQAQKLFLEMVSSARSGASNKEEDLWHERQDPE